MRGTHLLAARLAPILAAAALNMACSDDDPVAGDDADGVPPPVSADASVDHSTPRIVPHVKPSAVAAVRYPQLPADEIAVLPLQTVGRLAGECRDLVRSGCLPIYGRGVELTRGKPTLKAEHVQYLFDSANELARQTLWEDGELTEDRFAAEDSNVAGPEAANTLAGVTRAERIYLQIIERFPGTPWQAQAALERARLYCNGLSARWDRVHRDRARRLFAEVVRDFPKTPQAAQAAQELQKLGRQKRR